MRELMAPPIPFPNADQIKSKILLESARLFAVRRYDAVTVQNIADAVGVRPTLVYRHFPSKLNIMESMMRSVEEQIHEFYNMLDRLSHEAESFPQVINNLFVESKEVVNPFSFHAIYCAMANQFSMECCRHLYYDVYFMEGHMVMRRQLEIAIRRGLVEPFDVAQIATLITNCFVTMISMNVGQINGLNGDFDDVGWYGRTIEHVLWITGVSRE